MFEQLIEELVNKIEFSIDPGIIMEIKDFYKSDQNVKEFNVEIIDNQKYIVYVRLKNYSLQEVKKMFSAFLNFIQYSNVNFYVRTNNDEKIKYTLISAKENLRGFYCEVIFLN